jgi:uncharacterized protein YaaW (UPF0174 family)
MKVLSQRFENAQELLDKKDYENSMANVATILGISHSWQSTQPSRAKMQIVTKEFASAAGHSAMNALRFIGVVDQLDYIDVLRDVAKQMKIPIGGKSVVQLENTIIRKFLSDFYKNLDPRAQKKLLDEIAKQIEGEGLNATEFLKKAAKAGPAVALMTGNLAGFGIYLAATTALAGISNALGLGLSFAAYTGLSRFIGAALGPIGIILTSMYTVYAFGEPSYQKKIIPCILIFSSLRSLIEQKKTSERMKTTSAKKSTLRKKKVRIKGLVSRMKK